MVVRADVGNGDVVIEAPRRVLCREHGVVIEHIPWSEGNQPITTGDDVLFSAMASQVWVNAIAPSAYRYTDSKPDSMSQ